MTALTRITIDLEPGELQGVHALAARIFETYPGAIELRDEDAGALWSLLHRLAAAERCGARPPGCGLTKTQYRTLIFIARFIRAHGYSPTFKEIGESLGSNSTGHAHRVVSALAARGWITVPTARQRAIALIAVPTNAPEDLHERAT